MIRTFKHPQQQDKPGPGQCSQKNGPLNLKVGYGWLPYFHRGENIWIISKSFDRQIPVDIPRLLLFGFNMQNCWGPFTPFNLAQKKSSPHSVLTEQQLTGICRVKTMTKMGQNIYMNKDRNSGQERSRKRHGFCSWRPIPVGKFLAEFRNKIILLYNCSCAQLYAQKHVPELAGNNC